jgi:hypothetical protein
VRRRFVVVVVVVSKELSGMVGFRHLVAMILIAALVRRMLGRHVAVGRSGDAMFLSRNRTSQGHFAPIFILVGNHHTGMNLDGLDHLISCSSRRAIQARPLVVLGGPGLLVLLLVHTNTFICDEEEFAIGIGIVMAS